MATKVVSSGVVSCQRLMREASTSVAATEEERTWFIQAIPRNVFSDYRLSARIIAHLFTKTNAGRWSITWRRSLSLHIRAKNAEGFRRAFLLPREEASPEVYEALNEGERKVLVATIDREVLVIYNLIRKGDGDSSSEVVLEDGKGANYSKCYHEVCSSGKELFFEGGEEALGTIYVPFSGEITTIVALDFMSTVEKLSKGEGSFPLEIENLLREKYNREIKMYRYALASKQT